MGCFASCCPTLKHKKFMKSLNNNSLSPPSKHQCLQSLLQIPHESEFIIGKAKPSHIEDTALPIADSKEKEKVTFDLDINQEDEQKDGQSKTEISTDSSLFSFPLDNHNCKSGDDENQEESSESLFSLSIDSIRRNLSRSERDEVNSPLKPNRRDSSPFVKSVLNPIQCIVKPGAAKEKKPSSPLMELQEKENQNVEPSLSGWLVEKGKKTLNSEDSPDSVGNLSQELRRTKSKKESGRRPILGELNLEDIQA
ncbi:unnamed protein product [Cuscuta europaea]|uniref:Uncharacterized protein n=1 Tax=Cuscuta europaea TaxID=41803 RepID=A0A9P0ZFS5_CUSEU|nr:unnamed protein product [Cuscuta europaea]